MNLLHSSTSISEFNSNALRRSDRKRTKKIFKDDFMLPNPFKGKFKKHRGLRLPQNLGSQIRKIQFLTEKTLATLNYGKQQFSVEMLNQMKQAVNQQQIKLSQFLSIKLTGDKYFQQNKIYLNAAKMSKITKQKENYPKIQQNTIVGECQKQHDFHKQVMGIATAEQLCQVQSSSSMQEEGNSSAFMQQNEFCLAERLRFRKQSSKLLSDNYENNELMYTIEHMIPNWHQEEISNCSEQKFSN